MGTRDNDGATEEEEEGRGRGDGTVFPCIETESRVAATDATHAISCDIASLKTY